MRTVLAIPVLCALVFAFAAAEQAPPPASVTVAGGFTVETIAHVNGARELAVASNGDLFVGTSGSDVVVVPNAQDHAATPQTFAHLDDRPVSGVTIAGDAMYLGGQFGVYRLPFRTGDKSARSAPVKIATVRPSAIASDHLTTTVAVAKHRLYASVGSSCNNCQPELDPTRATIQQMQLDGNGIAPKAVHIRNAIALAVNPETGHLWAGVAGQDELAHGHPYEIFDDVSAHPGKVDYGWPYCYENRKAAGSHDCSSAAIPRVVLPAYATPIGAAFYPLHPRGRYAFPEAYRGGAFIALHGSWHLPHVPPRVVFVGMRGDTPEVAVDWRNPDTQWREFLGGFQHADGARSGRPTGVAVGPDGSLFVAEDDGGVIYRIRPRR